ncbi:MAG TPA: NAD(P)-binding protein [Acidimicrobiales bacterium]|nr:NAD(P)-binding protein [Acidimicrobiales bacterium]
MSTITVVGGGLAGLVAAITAAEEGASVELHEAHGMLGGRGRSSQGPFVANLGPHALYNDGPMWDWLKDRRLLPKCGWAKTPTGLRARVDGKARRGLPAAMLRSVGVLRAKDVPVDVDFRSWVASRWGAEAAHRWSMAAGVVTFCADPGALSAAFVQERLARVYKVANPARFPVGGWTSVMDRLAAHAETLGVRLVVHSPVDSLPNGPVVVAVEPLVARKLLGDDSLRGADNRVALLDIGFRSARGDNYIVADLDESGFVERFTRNDRTLAPAGHELAQGQVGMRPGETLEQGVARVEALYDLAYPGWREREVWRRRSVFEGRSGALDYPGMTWRDRPAVDRGDGVWLTGDWVAAPGVLGEVSWASGVEAGRAAARAVRSGTRVTPLTA